MKEGVTLTKLEVAVSQLNQAMRLFLEGDHVSSLTLAGAAEEILGALCKRAGHPVAVEDIIAFHMKDTDPALSEKERRNVLLGVLNQQRNAAKHAHDPAETHFVVEQDFALQMIMRAMPMAKMLGSSPALDAEMAAWIRSHPEAIR